MGTGGVTWGVSEFLQVVCTKLLDICYHFAAVLILIFFTAPSWKGMPLGVNDGTVGGATVCSHRLSVQTIMVSGTVWPQFAKQVLTTGCNSQFGGKGWL